VIECHRCIDADKTVATLERLVAERATAPAFIRCDNGPERTAKALKDWCRFSRAGSLGSETVPRRHGPLVVLRRMMEAYSRSLQRRRPQRCD
jgi:hypothetical protein